MKKQYIIYAILLLLGGTIGYFLNSSSDTKEDNHSVEEDIKNETWTCSMHPQIRQPKAGDCPICGMDLIPLQSEGKEEARVTEGHQDQHLKHQQRQHDN